MQHLQLAMALRTVFLLLVVNGLTIVQCQEPYCASFSLLEQLLEKIVRMEARIETLENSKRK